MTDYLRGETEVLNGGLGLEVSHSQFMTLQTKHSNLGFLEEVRLNSFKTLISIGWETYLSETKYEIIFQIM